MKYLKYYMYEVLEVLVWLYVKYLEALEAWFEAWFTVLKLDLRSASTGKFSENPIACIDLKFETLL